MNLRDEVLHLLLSSPEQFISGAAVAQQFQVSRNAVWKAVEQLKSEGVRIASVPNRGYKLESVPDLYDEKSFLSLVKDCKIPWKVQWLSETASTNDFAKSLASDGAPEGQVIVADRQTMGKGRLGRQFHSPKGGLYMSLILRPKLPPTQMMAVTACTAAAVHQALAEFGITAQIKWVNDLFLNGRKICGILSEGSFNAELLRMDYLVIGIGINLHPDPHLSEELQPIVTDLQTETGQSVLRVPLLAAILRQLDRLLPELSAHTFLSVYSHYSMTIGRMVRVQGQNGELTAKAVGFSDDAGLIVEKSDGSREIIRTGTAMFVDSCFT